MSTSWSAVTPGKFLVIPRIVNSGPGEASGSLAGEAGGSGGTVLELVIGMSS
jgi:hypothetical protein